MKSNRLQQLCSNRTYRMSDGDRRVKEDIVWCVVELWREREKKKRRGGEEEGKKSWMMRWWTEEQFLVNLISQS